MTVGSAVDPFEPAIRALMAEFPSVPVSVIKLRVGWSQDRTVSFERAAILRPSFVPPIPRLRRQGQVDTLSISGEIEGAGR